MSELEEARKMAKRGFLFERPSYYERMKRIWNKKKIEYVESHEYPNRFKIVGIITSVFFGLGLLVFFLGTPSFSSSVVFYVSVGLLLIGTFFYIFVVLFLNIFATDYIVLTPKAEQKGSDTFIFYEYSKKGHKEAFEGLDEGFARAEAFLSGVEIPEEELEE